jgi:hypothetical protein
LEAAQTTASPLISVYQRPSAVSPAGELSVLRHKSSNVSKPRARRPWRSRTWAGRPCHSEPRPAHRVLVPESVLLDRSGTGVPPVGLTWHGRPANVLVDLCIKVWRLAHIGIRHRTYDQEHLARKFHPPSEHEDQTVIWSWGALAPVSEQNGARAPHPHETFGLGPAGTPGSRGGIRACRVSRTFACFVGGFVSESSSTPP